MCDLFSFRVAVVKYGQAACAVGDGEDVLTFNIVFVDEERQPRRGAKVVGFYDDHCGVFCIKMTFRGVCYRG